MRTIYRSERDEQPIPIPCHILYHHHGCTVLATCIPIRGMQAVEQGYLPCDVKKHVNHRGFRALNRSWKRVLIARQEQLISGQTLPTGRPTLIAGRQAFPRGRQELRAAGQVLRRAWQTLRIGLQELPIGLQTLLVRGQILPLNVQAFPGSWQMRPAGAQAYQKDLARHKRKKHALTHVA